VNTLAQFLMRRTLGCQQLFLQGNPISEPISLILLLKDPRRGMAGMSELHLDSGTLTCELLWRIFEVCASQKSRPPFRLCFGDGQLSSEHMKVMGVAEDRGLKAAGIGRLLENVDGANVEVLIQTTAMAVPHAGTYQ